MHKTITLFWASVALTIQTFGQADTLQKIHIGFIYPVSSNGKNAAHISNNYSFHALSGISKNENILSVAGISNHIKHNARGIQIAGLINRVGNSANGVQIAGLGNLIQKETNGLQIAGLINRSGPADTQISGLVNVAENVNGPQIAGLINKARDVKSVQIAGLTNTSGPANTQISGLVNVAENVNVLQIAGLINKARDVKGIQIAGLINIADSSDYPIGVINIIKNGKQTVGLSYDETGTALLTYRSGGRVLYGVIGLGYNLNSGRSKDYYGFEAGIGAHIVKSENFLLNGEAFAQSLTDFRDFSYTKHGIRLLPVLRMAGRFEIFAGPSFNLTRFDTDSRPNLHDKYFWSKEKKGHFTGMSIGYTAGIQVSL